MDTRIAARGTGRRQRCGPGVQHRFGGRAQRIETSCCDECRCRGLKARVERRGSGGLRILEHQNLTQVGERAVTTQFRQGRSCGRHRLLLQPLTVEIVDLQSDVDDLRSGAVGAGEVTHVRHLITGDEGRRLLRRSQGDRGDAGLVERLQLAHIGDRIAVGIDPHAELREDRVRRIDHPVGVGIVGGERLEARLHTLVEGDHPVAVEVAATTGTRAAEEFGDVVDRSIAVAVEGEKPVVRAHPAGLLGKAVAVDVEARRHRRPSRQADTVAVEIEYQRVDTLPPTDAHHRLHVVPEHRGEGGRDVPGRLTIAQEMRRPAHLEHIEPEGPVRRIRPIVGRRTVGDEDLVAEPVADHEFPSRIVSVFAEPKQSIGPRILRSCMVDTPGEAEKTISVQLVG